ncbi:MAG TPA: cytochrome P460 family protein [Gaiellaceae bacterium]|nr:cytochrome P460 family protein [Gaiellaceae bacterium]
MGRAVTLVVLALSLAACGGEEAQPEPATDSGTTSVAETAAEPVEPPPTLDETVAETDAEPPSEAAPGLPAELAGYDRWPKLNDAPIPPRDSDPHDGTKDVYASMAAGADGLYPEGAIVVKEATRPGADFVGLVAMMRKEAGADPEHNDWVMIEWVRDSRGAPYVELARGAVCTSCHLQARATDYVFTR